MNAYFELAAKYTALQAENQALRANIDTIVDKRVAAVRVQCQEYLNNLAAEYSATLRVARADAALKYRARATKAEHALAELEAKGDASLFAQLSNMKSKRVAHLQQIKALQAKLKRKNRVVSAVLADRARVLDVLSCYVLDQHFPERVVHRDTIRRGQAYVANMATPKKSAR
jgi:hypothetical protein